MFKNRPFSGNNQTQVRVYIHFAVTVSVYPVKKCLNLCLFRRKVVPLSAERKGANCADGLLNGLYDNFLHYLAP